MNNNNNTKKIVVIILLLLIIFILLYLLIHNFGNIENRGPLVPTGNVDIFEIDCNCDNCDKDVFKEDDTNKNKLEQPKDIVVFDDYKIWDNKKLRIFSNPAYEYESMIAPGSMNSYAFVIRNNNNFDVVVDIGFKEENDKNINMQYKVRNNGSYLIGNRDNYELIEGKKITQIKLPAKSQKPYILDWKWIDSDNDTEIGLDADANYKLSIIIEAN